MPATPEKVWRAIEKARKIVGVGREIRGTTAMGKAHRIAIVPTRKQDGGLRFAPPTLRAILDRNEEPPMPRHKTYVPHGVIPAVLLPFHDDLSIDEANFRKHLRDVTSAEGLSAITINAHSTEVASCTFDEQRRVLDIAGRTRSATRLPLVNGIWADGSLEAARLAKMATAGGASALLVFPPAPFTMGQNAAMALAHFKRIADATDLPLIAFQYPLATGQGYPNDTMLRMIEEMPTLTRDQGLGRQRRSSTSGMSARCRTCRGRSTCCRRRARG